MILIILWIIITMLLIVEGALLSNLYMMIFGGFSAVALAFFGIIYYTIYSSGAQKRIAEKEEILKENIDFASGLSTPTLKKRSSTSGMCFYISPFYDADFKYNPEEITFTSVTVGGVTTGGISKTDAHYSTTNKKPTGRYLLMSNKVEIEKIILTDELLKEAKNDPNINKFIVGNKIVLKHNSKQLSSGETAALKEAYMNKNLIVAKSLLKDSIINSKLTRDECIYIKNWIYGDYDAHKEKIRSQNKKFLAILLSVALIVSGIFVYTNTKTFRFRNYNFKITDYENNLIINRKDFESVYEEDEGNTIKYTIYLTPDGQKKLKDATEYLIKQDAPNNQLFAYKNNILLFSDEIKRDIDVDPLCIYVPK